MTTSIAVEDGTSNSDVKAKHQENSVGASGCIGGLNNAVSSVKARVLRVWTFAKEDTSRVIFAFKVGLAVVLVSLLILIQAPYGMFGANIMWSIITVVIMFEYTVGMPLVLVPRVCETACRCPCNFHSSDGSAWWKDFPASFMKQWPSLVPYEYGFRVTLLTFCLIILSSYRTGNPIRTAMERLYSIALGAFVAVFVNVLIFPLFSNSIQKQ